MKITVFGASGKSGQQLVEKALDMGFQVKLILRIPIADHNINEQRIQKSNLKWTIFRPGRLTNEPPSEDLKFDSDKPNTNGNLKISRASLAAFILNQVSENTFIRKALWVNESTRTGSLH